MGSAELSRPAALAAQLTGADAAATEHLFTTKRVVLRLEDDLAANALARETLVLSVNEILRFCPHVTIELPEAAVALQPRFETLAAAIHGNSTVAFAHNTDARDATLSVGTEVRDEPNWITVNGRGWLSRIATSAGDRTALPQGFHRENPIGCLGAACLGAGQVFLALVGRPLLAEPLEISLFSLEQGAPGDIAYAPNVRTDDLELDVLLVGCGGVANGWVYATRESDVHGRVEAVDHQAQRPENLGPYVCATRDRIGTPKANIVKDELSPRVTVIPRPERFRFFKARIGYGQTYVPEIALSALDNAHTRREVQQLWAPVTIDLAAEDLTSQVIVKRLDDDGQCLLEAYTDPMGDEAELAALARATGLSVERLRDFETPITEDDIAAAPPEKRAKLKEALRRGQLVCGRVGDLDLREEECSAQFAPAVPFVTAFTGIVALAQTLRTKIAPARSLHFQFSFNSFRSRTLELRCSRGCECAASKQ